MLGQLVGDSLGALVEFKGPGEIRREWPEGVRELVDGGTWDTIAGQPTDDSEMALGLARVLVQRGAWEAEGVREAYLRWYESEPFDVGNTIGGALCGRMNPGSQANGAMMRISPLAILGLRHPLELVTRWAMEDARITHPNRVCVQANALYVRMLVRAIEGVGVSELYRLLLSDALELDVDRLLLDALKGGGERRPADYIEQAGWVLVAFDNAIFQLLHAADLEDGVVDTVMQGGDTDTNAAIAGALLGAVYGEDSIPDQWRQAVLSCRPKAGVAGVFRPRPEEYWPVDAVRLADALLSSGLAEGL